MNGQAKSLPHYNQMNSISVEAVPAPNVAMGDAIAFFEQLAKTDLPLGYTYASWVKLASLWKKAARFT